MPDEITELLDTAIYKEIAAQAVYIAAQSKTQDPGARALLKELADEEIKHKQWLKEFKDKGWEKHDWHPKKVPDLMIGEYLTAPDTVEGANLQEVLAFAIKREQQAMEFYSKMISALRDEAAKRLCENLAREELKHKRKVEILYDDLFYAEY